MPISWHTFDTVSGILTQEMALVATRVGSGEGSPHSIDPTNVSALVDIIARATNPTGQWKSVDKAASTTSISSAVLAHGSSYVAVLRTTDRVDRSTVCLSSGFGVCKPSKKLMLATCA